MKNAFPGRSPVIILLFALSLVSWNKKIQGAGLEVPITYYKLGNGLKADIIIYGYGYNWRRFIG